MYAFCIEVKWMIMAHQSCVGTDGTGCGGKKSKSSSSNFIVGFVDCKCFCSWFKWPLAVAIVGGRSFFN